MVFFLALLPAALLGPAAAPDYFDDRIVLIFLFLTALTTLVGIIDDVLGTRTVTGLKGHLGRLLRGELTTGGLKAVAIALGSLIVFAGTVGFWEALLNAALVSLFVNTLNMFDLRPGRAGKIFLLIALAVTITAWNNPNLIPMWAVVGSLAAFFPLDLRAKAMMGDAGANTLGAVVGLTVALTLGVEARLGILGVLVILHVLAERYSFSKIIAGNRFLSFLDLLGRRD
jgi:UDP-N-acetylmuramyl pentapeptide phosphotransferase/UDP-N-acetylglucosamine-1-phosphate transferase